MKENFKDYIWSFFGKLIGLIGIFLVNIVVSNNLSVDDFAQFSILMSIIPSMVAITTFGQEFSSSKMLNTSTGWKNHIRNISMVLVLNFSLLFFLFLFIGNFYVFDKSILFILFFIICFSSIMRVISDYSRATYNFKGFILYNSIRSNGGIIFWLFFFILLSFLLITDALSIVNIFISIASSCFIVLFIFFFVQFSKKDFVKNIVSIFNRRTHNFFTFYKTSFYLMLSGLLIMLRFDHDIWIVSYAAGNQDVALYASIIKIVALVMAPIAIFESLIPKKIAALYNKNDMISLEHYVRRISTFIFISGLPFILFIYIFAGEILYYTFGEFYANAENGLRLALFAFCGNILLGPCGPILLIIKYEKINVVVNFLFLIISVILGTYLTLKIGYHGMIINYIIILNLIHIVFYLLLIKYLKINPLPYLNFFRALKNN